MPSGAVGDIGHRHLGGALQLGDIAQRHAQGQRALDAIGVAASISRRLPQAESRGAGGFCFVFISGPRRSMFRSRHLAGRPGPGGPRTLLAAAWLFFSEVWSENAFVLDGPAAFVRATVRVSRSAARDSHLNDPSSAAATASPDVADD